MNPSEIARADEEALAARAGVLFENRLCIEAHITLTAKRSELEALTKKSGKPWPTDQEIAEAMYDDLREAFPADEAEPFTVTYRVDVR